MIQHIGDAIMNWVHHLTGWQATLAAAVLAGHDFVLWPLVYVLGTITGKKVKAPKRIRKH